MTKHKKRVSGELRQICPAIWIPVNEKGGNIGGKANVVSVGLPVKFMKMIDRVLELRCHRGGSCGGGRNC
jgi:hypothetical protein